MDPFSDFINIGGWEEIKYSIMTSCWKSQSQFRSFGGKTEPLRHAMACFKSPPGCGMVTSFLFFPLLWLSVFLNVSAADMYCSCHNRSKQKKLLKKKGLAAVSAGNGLPGESWREHEQERHFLWLTRRCRPVRGLWEILWWQQDSGEFQLRPWSVGWSSEREFK